ncbi:MAG: DNA-3-methyladenine glycosylase [Synergistaceae bacterium]|jgi:DNA-3-methyladenine glycosylase|nr:DNA-3-methyladenine glycosylase [Synergistaceae bacterium]
MNGDILERGFYMRGAEAAARGLLGAVLVRRSPEGTASGVIVETEAYAGNSDAACHSYGRFSESPGHRTNVMFGPGGYAYIYFIYGMYNCFNVVTGPPGSPEAVLVRALEPLDGIPLMMSRRGVRDVKKLCGGPGKLCMALCVTRELYGRDLCGDEIFILEGEAIPDARVAATRRVNVDYAGEASLYPYRFVVRDSEYLSTRRYIGA